MRCNSPSFAAKIINYPSERYSIERRECPRHNKWESLGNIVQKGKMMPVRPPDSFYSREKGRKQRQEGWDIRKRKAKQTYLANMYVQVKRE